MFGKITQALRMRFLTINDKKQCLIACHNALELKAPISFQLELWNEVFHDLVVQGAVKLQALASL